MARSRSCVPLLILAAVVLLGTAPVFTSPPRGAPAVPEVDARVAAAVAAGLSPLALEQPAGAYDSVVAMLQSWLVGGSVLTIIFAAALVAATANPLTKRRQEASTMK
eukprot:CAMPEP_0170596308 /NCGR_PEP_ID=MMETSP0224-20130122/15040_1 /TAXON_ID=285029 /ORGANISM="Togula jolla, Strain CCCM 725" /LENGTH=106 /DNA_ID=CAMNT_0010920575 /DNA_START=76 /DNA_END=396 /DNA_ORIENTATION=+